MRITAGSLAKRMKAVPFKTFDKELDVLVGIKTLPNGARVRDRENEAVLTAESHAWCDIGEAVVGREVMRKMRDMRFGTLKGGRWQGPAAEGAGEGAMGPSQFAAINYWSETVARILEATQLVKFEEPQMSGPLLTTLRPGVVQNLGRRPRYSPPTEKTKKLQPNEPIPMGSIDAEWIDVNPVEKHGQALAIATETMLFDGNQGAAVEAVGNISYQIGWAKEDRILRSVWGIENTYRYGAADSGGASTSFNTYYDAAAAQQYVNKVTVDLLSETDLDTVEQLFLGMKHPRTGFPINVTTKRMLAVTPGKLMVARRLSRITSIEQGARATAPAAVETTAPTWAGPIIDPMVSQRARDLMQTDFPEYGWTALTAAQAGKRAVYGDPQRAFEYREARPFQSWNWNMTQDPSLALNDCFMMIVGLEQGSVTTVEPRHVVLIIKDA